MNKIDELLLNRAELLYQVKLVKENTKGCSGNKIFEVENGFDSFILRVSKFSEKTREHTEFELKWLESISEKSDSLASPIRSSKNHLYEVIKIESESYIMCLFEKATGKNPDCHNPKEFNEELFFNLGAIMGDLHKLTASYEGNIINPKFQWDNDAYSWRGGNEILDSEVHLCERMLLSKIHELPITSECYGIIHYNIHIDNFFVDNGRIKLFDFEACQFNWYAADIASAIFFMVLKGAGPLTYKSEEERTEFAKTYITSLLKGYLTTNTISKFWIKQIDLFIQYQMTDEYRAAQSFWSEDLKHLQPWYTQWHKNRIVNNLPYFFVDYDEIIKNLPPIPDK